MKYKRVYLYTRRLNIPNILILMVTDCMIEMYYYVGDADVDIFDYMDVYGFTVVLVHNKKITERETTWFVGFI